MAMLLSAEEAPYLQAFCCELSTTRGDKRRALAEHTGATATEHNLLLRRLSSKRYDVFFPRRQRKMPGDAANPTTDIDQSFR
jgi:hypothetical protein